MWASYFLFLAKVVTVLLALIVMLVMVISARKAMPRSGTLKIRSLNELYRAYQQHLQEWLLDDKALKSWWKQEKKRIKEEDKADRPRVFVLNFEGDIQASAVAQLREEITAVLEVARPEHDRVVLLLESPGGVVHGYGLAASQLKRVRQAGLRLEICVDKVAASGGYMMAALADQVLAAPFAVVGSIGVVAQLPNFNRLLRKHAVDIELHTAGAYKRTLTLLGENTEEGRQKFREELESTHELFKSWVQQARPGLDLDKVATGEHWYGQQALELGLIDAIATSDEHLRKAAKTADVLEVRYHRPQPILERLSHAVSQAASSTLERILNSVRLVP